MFAMVGLSLALGTLAGGATGPCDVLARETAVQLLGQPLTAVEPSGPAPDEDSPSPATRTTCVYQAGIRVLIVTTLTFSSAAAARETTTRELLTEQLEEEEGARVTEEPGLGDKAYWGLNERTAEYIVLKGPKVMGVILGGMPKPPAMYQVPLRAVAASAASKL